MRSCNNSVAARRFLADSVKREKNSSGFCEILSFTRVLLLGVRVRETRGTLCQVADEAPWLWKSADRAREIGEVLEAEAAVELRGLAAAIGEERDPLHAVVACDLDDLPDHRGAVPS